MVSVPTDGKELFVRNLNLLMERRGLSQADIARELGVSTAIASSWCSGKKTPRMDKVSKLASLLNCDVSAFFSEDASSKITDHDRLEALHQNPSLGMLFDRAIRMSTEDVDFMVAFADKILKERE